MIRIRYYIIASICFWPLLAMSQSRDFEIRDFHENLSDLTAATSNVQDLNGVMAALIRIAVRDTLFTFDANNGIIKQEWDVGEVRLYVPEGTKRITIRHPKLGILRNYQLPCNIESKVTYDAEIVVIERETPQVEYPLSGKQPKEHTPIGVHFLLGGGFNALGMQGPFASIGFEIGKFFMGADFCDLVIVDDDQPVCIL